MSEKLESEATKKTTKLDSSPSSPSPSDLVKREENDSEGKNKSSNVNERNVIYKKILTREDVYYCRLMIPLESGEEFLPAPHISDGRYDLIEVSLMDEDGHLWDLTAAFDEMSSPYMFFLNWDKYVKKYDLKPEDVIFFYEDPAIEEYYSIGFERKIISNPKETTLVEEKRVNPTRQGGCGKNAGEELRLDDDDKS